MPKKNTCLMCDGPDPIPGTGICRKCENSLDPVNEIVPATRDVIADKLLLALQDDEVVAALLTEKDLDLLTEALETYIGICVFREASIEVTNPAIEMLASFHELKRAAFPA